VIESPIQTIRCTYSDEEFTVLALSPVFVDEFPATVVALAAGDGLELAVGPDPLHPAIETTNSTTKKTPTDIFTERISKLISQHNKRKANRCISYPD
jgi:hypothetical protein